jgi:Ca-activated chloride channel family protein
MFGVNFAHPWFGLFALLVLPALWWSTRSAGRVLFSSLRVIPAAGGTWRTALVWLPDALIGLALFSFAIALTGPWRGDDSSRIRRDGISIMMAVDVSGSMRALDLSEKNRELTRLDAVKEVFEQFVVGGHDLHGRPDDAVGLIAFARYAETRSPLTLDHANLVVAAHQLEFARDRDEDGTAIGAGLELAVQRLIDAKTTSKIAILLTDGESNIHEIDEQTAIDDAKRAGIKVYTIGAGTNGIAPIRVDRGNGVTNLMQIEVSIDEALLRKLADETGGRYFRATDNSSLRSIYDQIDKLERTTIEDDVFADPLQYYPWFVVIGMGLVVVALVLRATLLRRLP